MPPRRRPRRPHDVALGVKAVVTLPCAAIEERFGLIGNEGAASSFDGEVTVGLMGGGFVYTNLDSLSAGLVVRLDDLTERGIKPRSS
jgi:electron transfer flavoprotein-quinone oxidoreductase